MNRRHLAEILLGELAVAQRVAAVRERRRLLIVGDKQYYRFALARDRSKQLHDLVAASAVEVPGGLVGQDQARFARECTSDRDTLTLASGERLRSVVQAVRQADALKPRYRTGVGFAYPEAADDQLASRVLDRRHTGHQVEALEDEADITQEVLACLIVGE